ncbi:hypothetical protein DM02DRAFT_620058 [Periconia macrospinosa]|uniref:Uncharacterized protein n=1 Tax=Periconia macrospinosa TaxID=97972 RepID=A0A2V1D3M8_9PLEO|nr:hypothetical protein DM02DRAFT_620058 [Periconia macrospinosa]
MKFTTTLSTLLFTLAATALPTPNNPYGVFLVAFNYNSTNGYESLSSGYFPTGEAVCDDPFHDCLRNSCVYAPQADPPFPKRCDRLGFTYDFNPENNDITLEFTLPGKNMTVWAEGTVEWESTRWDGVKQGEATAQVFKAIA